MTNCSISSPYSLAAFKQINKEALFVVKRGKHVDYQQTKVPVLRPADILPSLAILFIDTSIIEDNEDFIVIEEYPDDTDDAQNPVTLRYDAYKNPDEYDWLHLTKRVHGISEV